MRDGDKGWGKRNRMGTRDRDGEGQMRDVEEEWDGGREIRMGMRVGWTGHP